MILKKVIATMLLLAAFTASAKNIDLQDIDNFDKSNYQTTLLCENCSATQALDIARLVPHNLIKTNVGVTLLLKNLPAKSPVIATYTDQGTLEIINYQSVGHTYKLPGNLNNLLLMLNEQASVLIKI